MARFVWGWASDRLSKWLLDPRRHRLFLFSCVILLAAATAASMLAVVFGSTSSRVTDPNPSRVITLDFAPSALLAADGLLYAGSAHGDIVSLDAVRGSTLGHAELPEPVDYIVAHGDHIYVGGEETLARLDPNLGQPLSRPVEAAGYTTLHALAAGPLGVWGIVGGRLLVHFSSQSLKVVQQFGLSVESGSLAVGARGVWIAPRGATYVLLARPTPIGWRLSRSPIGCQPTTVVAEHNRAYVLCDEARRVVVLTDLGGRRISEYAVGEGDTAVTVTNGSLWLLSPDDDHITQYALVRHRRVGNPVSVGSEAEHLAADTQALWVGENNDTVTRIDLQKLAIAQDVSRSPYARTELTGTQRGLLVLFALAASVALSMVIVLRWQNRVNGNFPTYFPPRRLVVYALHAELFVALASGKVERQVGKRSLLLGGQRGVSASIGRSQTTAVGGYPQSKHVRDNIVDWRLKGILYTGANFVPGARHRGLRRKPVADPSEDILLEHWQRISDQGSICLIAGCEWLVGDEGDHVRLILDYVLDRTAGHMREIPRPTGAHLSVRVKKSHLTPIGGERCCPGERVRIDVICNALPHSPGEAPMMDLVVAWLPVKAASDISKLGNYVLSLPSRRHAPDGNPEQL
jgi:hypothetical protein